MNTTQSRDGMSTGRLFTVILLFVIIGAPMVYYLWTTLNEVLAGQFDGPRLGVAIVVLLIFVGVLTILSRSIRRWDERLH